MNVPDLRYWGRLLPKRACPRSPNALVFGSYALYPGNPVLVPDTGGHKRSVSRMTAQVYSSLVKMNESFLILFGVPAIEPKISSCSSLIRAIQAGFFDNI